MEHKSLIPQAECQSIISEFDAILAESPHVFWQDEVQSDARLYFAERHSKRFRDLYEAMLKQHEAKCGQSPNRYSFLMMNRVMPKSGNKGSGGGWHRDSWKKQAKTFAFLTDVGENNGPFEYVKATNGLFTKLWDYMMNRGSLRADSAPPGKEIVTLTVPAGTVETLDTTLLHRGRPIQEGARYAATLYVFDVSAKKTEFLKRKFAHLDRSVEQETPAHI